MWEITKTFAKTAKVPKDYLVSTTTESEGEILQDDCHVDKKAEKTVTKVSNRMFGGGENERSVQGKPRNGKGQGKKNAKGNKNALKESKDFVIQTVDAKIGDLTVRFIYFPSLNA